MVKIPEVITLVINMRKKKEKRDRLTAWNCKACVMVVSSDKPMS